MLCLGGDCSLLGDLSTELFYDPVKFFLDALLPYCLAFSILSFLIYFEHFSCDEFLFSMAVGIAPCLEAEHPLVLLSNLLWVASLEEESLRTIWLEWLV